MKIKKVIFSFIILFLVILLIPLILPAYFPEINRMIGLGLGTTKVGTMTIGGANPQVVQIYIKEGAGPWQALSNNPDLDYPGTNALGDDTKNIEVRATIFDTNADCASFSTSVQYAYICEAVNGGPPTCNPEVASPTYTLGGSPGDVTIDVYPDPNYCNITWSNTFGLQYWRRWEDWPINVTIEDTDNLNNDTVQYWFYNPSLGLEYPYPTEAAVVLGGVDAGTWNDGRPAEGDTLKNIGNIRINITWNATDFVGSEAPFDPIPILADTFCLDRDQDNVLTSPFSDGTYVQQCMNDVETIPEWYEPTGGVHRCGGAGVDECDNDEDGLTNEAKYLQYWHIDIPSVSAGEYNDTIEYHGYEAYGAW